MFLHEEYKICEDILKEMDKNDFKFNIIINSQTFVEEKFIIFNNNKFNEFIIKLCDDKKFDAEIIIFIANYIFSITENLNRLCKSDGKEIFYYFKNGTIIRTTEKLKNFPENINDIDEEIEFYLKMKEII